MRLSMFDLVRFDVLFVKIYKFIFEIWALYLLYMLAVAPFKYIEDSLLTILKYCECTLKLIDIK